VRRFSGELLVKKAKRALEGVFGGGFVAQQEGAGFGLRIG
jgi:hypothetical protein